MLRLRSHNGLGQVAKTIDPQIYLALKAAGEALRLQGDPGAPYTAELIKRNIEAPGFPTLTPGTPSSTTGRISDLNSSLQTLAIIRENPYPSIAAIVAIPVIAFLLGRASRRA